MNSDRFKIGARVTILSAEDGGRAQPAVDSPSYRPHLVVGDAAQRVAVTAADGRTLVEDYLGVGFLGTGMCLDPGRSHEVQLLLLYHPEVNYEALQLGATFTIREGGHIVGFGEVTAVATAAAV